MITDHFIVEAAKADEFEKALIKIANMHCPCGCVSEARDAIRKFNKHFILETNNYENDGPIHKREKRCKA